MKKVTITDVAIQSGFGVATVSRVIHGDKSVKESTRDAINKVIEELHFTPNMNGVRLQQGRSLVIAVMVPLINHPFFAKFVEQVEEEAAKNGYSTLVVASKMHVDKENEILDKIRRREVDGAIFVTHYEHSDEELQDLPLVSIDRHLNDAVPYISSDNYEASRKVVERFIQNGAQKIGFIGTKPYVDSEVSLREKAYLDVMKEHHLEAKSMFEVTEHGDEEQLVERFLKTYPDLDAIYASGNTVSQIIYQKLLAMGKKMPEEMELVGYDGVFYTWDHSSISSIRQPIEDMAKASVNILLKIINDEKVPHTNIFPTEFIPGSTTK